MLVTHLPNVIRQPVQPFSRFGLVAFTIVTSMLMSACDHAKSTVPKSQTTTNTGTASTTALTTASASNVKNNAKLQQTLATNLTKSGIDAKVLSVTPTTMPGMYWVKAEGLPPFFTDSTGQYILQGDVIKVGKAQPEHISADLMAQDTKAVLANIDKKDMIIFPAKGATKAVIYVFTDADCAYCRQLHSEINETNSLGIEVRYLPWPRSEQTFPIMENIWCSQDRNAALTQAKQGMPVQAAHCDNPVRRIRDLGASLGISGTPAIFTQEGKQIGGYLPSTELAKTLGIH